MLRIAIKADQKFNCQQSKTFDHHTNGDQKWVLVAIQEILVVGW
jgi:hypothetical protein